MLRLPRHDSAPLRALANWGATTFPRGLLKWSPGPVGLVVGGLQRRLRDQIRENLRLVHGVRPAFVEAFDIATTTANYGHCFAEGLAMAGASPPRFRYTVEELERLAPMRDAGRGAIFVSAHTGSWDVASGAMSARGFDFAIAMAAEPDEGARAISDRARTRLGVKVFHVGSDPLCSLLLAQHIRRGGAVALQIDRVLPGMRTREAMFFGKSWSVPVGPFRLARITSAPLIPVFTARVGFAHHVVHADEPIDVSRNATDAEIDRAMAHAMRAVERFVRRFPTQWFHFAPHPRHRATTLVS